MIWDGMADTLHKIRQQHPSAVIYAMQTKVDDGYIYDELYGSPVLIIEDRATQPGRVFEIGMEVK